MQTNWAAKVNPGLSAVCVNDTNRICEPEFSRLRYCGYDIVDLVMNTCFEEVAHLILYGDLPNRDQLRHFRERVQEAMKFENKLIASVIDQSPADASPMHLLQAAIALLANYDQDAHERSRESNVKKAERLLGHMAAVAGKIAQRMDTSGKLVTIDQDATYGANFLALIRRQSPARSDSEVFDKSLILFAEHGFNAGTFGARVIASTESNMHSAVCGAIGALQGRLHGGAIEEALKQFKEIGRPKDVESWFNERENYNYSHPKAKKLYMGYGHRVYEEGDVRVPLMKELALRLQHSELDNLIHIEETLTELLVRRKRKHANLDCPASYTFHALGIKPRLFSIVFACSRVVGWCAHIIEQHENNDLIRPVSEYRGPGPRRVTPIAQR